MKRGYLWVTLALFIISLLGHWTAGWFIFVKDQQAHHQPIQVAEYAVEMTRDTLENWQSEFLQLIWQVAGLSFLWYVGSPQSKEGDERKDVLLQSELEKPGEWLKYRAIATDTNYDERTTALFTTGQSQNSSGKPG